YLHCSYTLTPLFFPRPFFLFLSFFFNDPATTEIYTLSLHDALPISILPALAIDLVVAAFPVPRYSALAPVLAGVALSLVLYTQEAVWMAWAVGRPWDLGRVAAAFPGVTLTAIGSAWVGWVLGALVASVAAGRPAGKTFGSRQSARATVAA